MSILIADEFAPNGPELSFLAEHVKLTDRVWEWGAGLSSKVLVRRCRSVTTVEHNPVFAARACLELAHGLSVLYVPPDAPFMDEEDDGDGDTFRSYVNSYTGEGIDVVMIDGRARVACARRVAETAPFGPVPRTADRPGTRIFLHDWEREEYLPIFQEPDGYFRKVDHVGRMALLEPRL